MSDVDLRSFAVSLYSTARHFPSLDRNMHPMMTRNRSFAILESACYLPQAQECP